MPVTNIKTVNFGKSKSGLTGDVGYTLYAADGTVSQLRTTSGIYEFGTSGIYASEVTFDIGFHGTIFWDVTADGNTVYASEEYNFSSAETIIMDGIADNVEFIRHIEGGQWTLDPTKKHMVFYEKDNITEVARFALFDRSGKPSISSVFRRKRIPVES
jgi:hypothetical protein